MKIKDESILSAEPGEPKPAILGVPCQDVIEIPNNSTPSIQEEVQEGMEAGLYPPW